MVRLNVQKSEETRRFYDNLVDGKISRGLWGKERRFSPYAIAGKRSVFKHFTSTIELYISKSDHVLDLGCGPGGFLSIISSMCKSVIGVDITPNFITECNAMIKENKIQNASSILIAPGTLPFPDTYFDKIVMVDTIHHLENIHDTLNEIARVLKKNGLLLIFEPNKLNPLLYLLCLLDKNEHGLLRLGTVKKYTELLGSEYNIVERKYSGLLIGPESRLSLFLADVFSTSFMSPFLGWLSPKIFISARKK
jgi:SAM-dependent methyltransferase